MKKIGKNPIYANRKCFCKMFQKPTCRDKTSEKWLINLSLVDLELFTTTKPMYLGLGNSMYLGLGNLLNLKFAYGHS